MRLKDKVALVTGAGSGIGEAIARRFAAEGAHVVVNYHAGGRHAQDAVDLAKELSQNTEALAVPADVSDRGGVQTMVDEAVKKFGRLDVAVMNAGVEQKKPFVDLTDDDWNRVLTVNLFGSFLVSQIAARQMLKQDKAGGSLVFISSVHEDVPFPDYTSYCASKGAIRMLMRNIALDLAPKGVRANNIAPGAIHTPINDATINDPQAYQNAIGEIPMARFGRPDEVASVALFLASDEASYVTGSTYLVDGGLEQQVTKY